MASSETQRAFKVVRAAQLSKRERFFNVDRKLTCRLVDPPTRDSVNQILNIKRALEGKLHASFYICGGGYACFEFELSSDDGAFSLERLKSIFAEENFAMYVAQNRISAIFYRGGDGNGEERLFGIGRSS